MSQAHDDLVARAQDPRTPLTTLHSLAQNYPGLRPAIARNPSTYPALLEWLGSLGDPAVDAALAARTAPATGQSNVALSPVVIPSRQRRHAPETATQPTTPTEAAQAPTSSDTAAAAGSSSAVAADNGDTPRPAVVNTAPQTTTQEPQPQPARPEAQEPQEPQPQASRPEPQETGYGSLEELRANAVEDTDSSSTGDNMLPWMALGAAVVVLVAVMLIVFTGGNRTAPLAAPSASASPTATRVPAVSQPPTVSSAPTADTPAPSPSAPPTTSAPTTPAAAPTATATPLPQLVAPAPQDAADLAAFTDPTGNITCLVSGQQASCSIKERSFAQAECPAEGAYKATVEPGNSPYGACVEDYQPAPTTLETGKSATQGDYVCTVGTGEVRCWSQSTGQGFSLAADGATSIDLTQR